MHLEKGWPCLTFKDAPAVTQSASQTALDRWESEGWASGVRLSEKLLIGYATLKPHRQARWEFDLIKGDNRVFAWWLSSRTSKTSEVLFHTLIVGTGLFACVSWLMLTLSVEKELTVRLPHVTPYSRKACNMYRAKKKGKDWNMLWWHARIAIKEAKNVSLPMRRRLLEERALLKAKRLKSLL